MPYVKQHSSPVLANKWWASDQNEYASYYRDERARQVRPRSRGKHQWGRRKRLWSREVELALKKELEDPVAPIYDALRLGNPPLGRNRLKWAQVLLSQAVQTPTVLRYEPRRRKRGGIVRGRATYCGGG